MKTALRLTVAAFGLALLQLSTTVAGAQDFSYTTDNGTITITGYTGSGGDVTIPDKINGLPVTTIGDCAFYECTSLTSITVPDSVTSIGWGAFSGCTSLTNVIIGNSVAYIDAQTFSGCSSLTGVEVDPNNPTYSSVGGVLFNKDQTTLIRYPEGKLGSSITIPNTVTSIGFGAFYGCTGLTGITIGSSVTSIGDYAFSGCTSLTSVTVPDSVTSIGDGAFRFCTSLTTATIGNSVSSIGFGAFYGCTGLTGITIGSSVTSIGQYEFLGCTNLIGVYFGGNAPTADEYVFYDATNATIYYLPGTIGWAKTFADRPTSPWVLPYPIILTTTPNFGMQTNAFGFRISWATNADVVVESSTTLANPTWVPISTNTLVNGWSDFSDAEWANYPARFYRVRSL